MTQIVATVTGLDAVQKALSPQQFEARLHAGLTTAGNLVAAQARNIVRPHHYTGRFEQQIHVAVTGTGLSQKATVGVSAAQVPEARPLSYGWKSNSGRMPPIEPIAQWVAKHPEISPSKNSYTNSSGFRRTRGSAASVGAESAVRGLAFVIARSIMRKGYSFPPLKVFETAYTQARASVVAALQKAIAGG